MARTIPLPRGLFAVVDDQDYDFVSQFNWHIVKDGKTFYARRSVMVGGKQKAIIMHREILNAPKGVDVDHVNGDGLLNTRSNLRLATASQNQMNRSMDRRNKTGVKGVIMVRSTGKYRAGIMANKIAIDLGYYRTLTEAAEARKSAEKIYHGQFARQT